MTEPPIVATGMERDVAQLGLLIRADRKGTVTYVDADSIEINETDVYEFENMSG